MMWASMAMSVEPCTLLSPRSAFTPPPAVRCCPAAAGSWPCSARSASRPCAASGPWRTGSSPVLSGWPVDGIGIVHLLQLVLGAAGDGRHHVQVVARIVLLQQLEDAVGILERLIAQGIAVGIGLVGPGRPVVRRCQSRRRRRPKAGEKTRPGLPDPGTRG